MNTSTHNENNTATLGMIEMVHGGFHMLPFDRSQTIELVKMLKNDLVVHHVAPAHCAGHLVFKLLQDLFGDDYHYAGLDETITYQ